MGAHYMPGMIVIARSKSCSRAGRASSQMPTTIVAVIKVTRTQPGTSPRSESSSSRGMIEPHALRSRGRRAEIRVNMRILSKGLEAGLEERKSRKNREKDGQGKQTEDEGDHHDDLLASGGLDETALRVVARIGGLRLEGLGQRRASLDRGDGVVDGAGEDRRLKPARHTDERVGERRAGVDLDRDRAELSGELAGSDIGDAAHAAEDPFARREAQGEELEHGGKLFFDAGETRLRLRGERYIGEDEAAREADDRNDDDGHRELTGRDRGEHEQATDPGSGDCPEQLAAAERRGVSGFTRLREPQLDRFGSAGDPCEACLSARPERLNAAREGES